MLIKEHGDKRTAEIVKGWVDNLAAPPFSNDTKTMEAILAGQRSLECMAVGIAESGYEYANLDIAGLWTGIFGKPADTAGVDVKPDVVRPTFIYQRLTCKDRAH